MKRVAVVLGIWFGLVGAVAYAEEPTVVQAPSNAYATFKKAVDVLDPQAEELYDIRSGEWYHGVSAALWHFTSNEMHLAALRVGYGFDQEPLDDDHELVYAQAKLDVPGIVTRLTPDAWESKVGASGLLSTTASLLGKYGAVGAFVGRDFQADETAYGVTLGGRVTW